MNRKEKKTKLSVSSQLNKRVYDLINTIGTGTCIIVYAQPGASPASRDRGGGGNPELD